MPLLNIMEIQRLSGVNRRLHELLAVGNTHLVVMQDMHKKMYHKGGGRSFSSLNAILFAASRGSMPALEFVYAYHQSFGYSSKVLIETGLIGAVDSLQWTMVWDILQYMRECVLLPYCDNEKLGLDMMEKIVRRVCRVCDDVDVLAKLCDPKEWGYERDMGVNWKQEYFRNLKVSALKNGRLKIYLWLENLSRDTRCTLTSEVYFAARGGNIELYDLMRERAVRWQLNIEDISVYVECLRNMAKNPNLTMFLHIVAQMELANIWIDWEYLLPCKWYKKLVKQLLPHSPHRVQAQECMNYIDTKKMESRLARGKPDVSFSP